MEKIFYAETGAFGPTERVMRKIFSEYYGMREIEIVKSETGKPFLARTPFFFSVTHTREVCFIAVSDENVGIDAELLSREIDYVPILSKFSAAEKAEIRSREDFLRHWTAKESVVKWLGGSHGVRSEKNRLPRRYDLLCGAGASRSALPFRTGRPHRRALSGKRRPSASLYPTLIYAQKYLCERLISFPLQQR